MNFKKTEKSPWLVNKNSKDISISTDRRRLMLDENKLSMHKNVNVVEKKSTNKQISEEQNFNNTKREPVVIVSLIYKCETHKKIKLQTYDIILLWGSWFTDQDVYSHNKRWIFIQ